MDYSIANRTPDVAQAVVGHHVDANGNAVPHSAAAPQPVSGGSYGSPLSLTRTADTNAYAAGDVIGTGTGSGNAVLDLGVLGPAAGGEVMITGATLEIDLAAVPSGMTSFRLHLYNAAPPSALADNAAWDLVSGDRASYLGYVDLGTPQDVGSTLFVQADQINSQKTMPAGHLFGYLVTNGGYTPASATVHKIILHAAGF